MKLDDFSRGIWDTETLHLFIDRLNQDKQNAFFNASVGLIYKWQGDIPKYHSIYHKLHQENPDYIAVLINFGNSMLLSGRHVEASELYQKALLINPNSVEAHYNLSLALVDNMNFVKAGEEYQKAYALGFNRVQRHEQWVNQRFSAQKTQDKIQPLPMDKIPDIPKLE